MALFKYKQAWLEWDAGKGYRNPVTTEWQGNPYEAVSGCVERYPDREEEWTDLARMIYAFWASAPPEAVGEIDEVCFDA